MDKRSFLKTSSILASGAILSKLVSCTNTKEQPLTNWAGNLTYSTGNVHYPETTEQVREVVKRCNNLRVLGSRHSFNKIADSTENQVSLKELNKVISLDKTAKTVTIEGGMRYGELCEYLDKNGFALHNLASLPHISVAGACATATHGSGVKNGNLSTEISAIEFVNAAGDLVFLSREKDTEQFFGAVVGLGGLGVVTKLVLDIQPTFKMKQLVYRNLSMKSLENDFNTIMSGGYSVSLFTNWKNNNISEVWIKSLVDKNDSSIPSPEFYGATLATKNMHPVEDQSAENCTEQMGIPGLWYERLPHFKMGFTPSTGKELQSEYFVPLENGYEAMLAIEKLSEKISPHLFISEIRTIDADNLWMSPCYKRASVTIHTTWKQDWDTVINLLPLMEKALEPFNPRPHWAKLFTIGPSVLQSRYEKLSDFRKLLNLHDPQAKFRNDFLTTNIF